MLVVSGKGGQQSKINTSVTFNKYAIENLPPRKQALLWQNSLLEANMRCTRETALI